MSDVRQDLMDAISDSLSAIRRPTFRTDAGLRVFEFRDAINEPLQAEELPCFIYRDTLEQVVALTAGVHEHALTIQVSAHEAASNETAEKLRELRADILQAFGDDTTFGGLATYCQPTGGEMQTERKGKTVGTVTLLFEIRYRTAAFDPETIHERPA